MSKNKCSGWIEIHLQVNPLFQLSRIELRRRLLVHEYSKRFSYYGTTEIALFHLSLIWCYSGLRDTHVAYRNVNWNITIKVGFSNTTNTVVDFRSDFSTKPLQCTRAEGWRCQMYKLYNTKIFLDLLLLHRSICYQNTDFSKNRI